MRQRPVCLLAPPGEDLIAMQRAIAGANLACVPIREGQPLAPNQASAVVVHVLMYDPLDGIRKAWAAGIPAVLASSVMNLGGSLGATWDEATQQRALFCRADAYVWRDEKLPEALYHCINEARQARAQGPLRLTYLGRSGADSSVGDGPRIGSVIQLPNEGGIMLGRGPQANVDLVARAIARQHVRIERPDRRAFVIDLHSANGTWIHRAGQVSQVNPGSPTPLIRGDELILAGFFRFRLDGAP